MTEDVWMTTKKTRWLYTGFILLLLIICAGSCLKTLVQQFNIDEQYAIVLGYRIATGEKMFIDLWEPHQTSGFVCAILIKLFMMLTDSTEYVVIYLRGAGILIQALVSIFTYITLKKEYTKWNSCLIAIIVFALQPKGIQVPEFSNLFIWSVLCTMLCLYNLYLTPQKFRRYSVLAAVFACVSVLCYPSFLIVIPLYIIGFFKIFDKKARLISGYFLGACIVAGVAYVVYFLTQMSVDEFLFGIKQMMTDGAHEVTLTERALFYVEELGIMLVPAIVCFTLAYICVKILGICEVVDRKDKNYLLIGSIALILSVIYQVIVWMNQNNGIYLHTPLSFYFIAYGIGALSMKEEPVLKWIFYIPTGGAFLAALILTNTGIRVTGSYLLPGILAVFVIMLQTKEVDGNKVISYVKMSGVVAFMLLLLFQRTYLVCETGGYKADISYMKQKALSGPAENVYCRWLDGTNYNEAAIMMEQYVSEGDSVLCVSSQNLWYLMKECRISNFSTISTPTFDERLFEYWAIHPEKYPKVVVVDKEFYELEDVEKLLDLEAPIYNSETLALYYTK